MLRACTLLTALFSLTLLGSTACLEASSSDESASKDEDKGKGKGKNKGKNKGKKSKSEIADDTKISKLNKSDRNKACLQAVGAAMKSRKLDVGDKYECPVDPKSKEKDPEMKEHEVFEPADYCEDIRIEKEWDCDETVQDIQDCVGKGLDCEAQEAQRCTVRLILCSGAFEE